MKPNTHAVTATVTFIANREDYTTLKRDVVKLAQIDGAASTGELSALNILVELTRRHGSSRLDRLWKVADGVHVAAFPEDRKVTYQAGYMAQRRLRLARATRIYEQYTGKQLQPPEREKFRKGLQATWMFWRDELVHGYPPGNDRNDLVRAFWDDIDAKLDAASGGDEKAIRYVLGEVKNE